MAYWEFLLQKEGDRDWLPLETAHVEISEGRYRVIAHTSYCDTPITIRLSQVLAAQLSPQPKTRQRVGQTNPNGLMVVMPFTHLSPGRWTIHCSADLPTNTASDQSREYGVQLQVLAIESGVEYWDIELDEATLAEQLAAKTSAETSASPGERSTALTEQLAEGTSSASAPVVNAAVTATTKLAGTTPPLEDLPLRLQLQHQALVAHAQTDLILQGQITTFSQVEGLASAGTLWVQMRNPETGVVVHQATQAQSMATLPSRFEMPLQLPAQLSTRLLVGELSLWLASEPPQILAIQGFTVTLNLDALLEVVANQAERSPETTFGDAVSDADEPAPETDGSPTLTDDSLDAEGNRQPDIASPAPREIPFRLVYLPSTGLTLPPVIYRPLDKKAIGAPSLPLLSGERQKAASPTPVPATPEPPATDSTLPPATPEATSTPAPTTPSPVVELPAFGRSRRPQPVPPAAASPAASVPAPAESLPTFQPDYQSRFWTRLSALAEEAQKAAADHKAQLEAAGLALPSVPTAAAQSLAGEPSQSDDAINNRPPNYEVVVYESEERAASPPDAEAATEVSYVEVLRPEDPDLEDLGTVPIPTLVLPQSELVAGDPLPITIRLPAYPRRLAVKVWVTDMQSRTLVDRPRWLMNWTPADAGEQTAFLKLQVPLGSVEATFEAIAIDLATQQESYKTTLVRAIAPANLPAIDDDDVI
ncbi:MAG: hypothetical protein AAGH67_07330 [Cyanobacteria bacterium P01_H01_bin.162]